MFDLIRIVDFFCGKIIILFFKDLDVYYFLILDIDVVFSVVENYDDEYYYSDNMVVSVVCVVFLLFIYVLMLFLVIL